MSTVSVYKAKKLKKRRFFIFFLVCSQGNYAEINALSKQEEKCLSTHRMFYNILTKIQFHLLPLYYKFLVCVVCCANNTNELREMETNWCFFECIRPIHKAPVHHQIVAVCFISVFALCWPGH